MRAYTDPSDDMITAWLDAYGTTGVKKHVLDEQPPKKIDGEWMPAIAWYREMSLAERQVLARIDAINDNVPAEHEYDNHRMLVNQCLLYPEISDYEKELPAVLELFQRVRQHGHAWLPGELDGRENQQPLPDHAIQDIETARQSAAKIFDDPLYSSPYRDIIIAIASKNGAEPADPFTLDWLMRQPAGRLRDIAARMEQVHASLLEESANVIEESVESSRKQEVYEQLRQRLYSPFSFYDQITEGQREQYHEPRTEDVDDVDDDVAAEPSSGIDHDDLRSALEGL